MALMKLYRRFDDDEQRMAREVTYLAKALARRQNTSELPWSGDEKEER